MAYDTEDENENEDENTKIVFVIDGSERLLMIEGKINNGCIQNYFSTQVQRHR